MENMTGMDAFLQKHHLQKLNRKEIDNTKKCCSSVPFCHSVDSDSLLPHEPQHARPPSASSTPRVHPDLCPSSRRYHSTISSSVPHFPSCLQSFSVSEFFPMSQPFTSGGQSIAASVSASVLPINIQGWFPLGLTVLISLLSTATNQWEGLFSWPTSFSH